MSESAQRRNASACAMSEKKALNEALRAPREAVASARYLERGSHSRLKRSFGAAEALPELSATDTPALDSAKNITYATAFLALRPNSGRPSRACELDD